MKSERSIFDEIDIDADMAADAEAWPISTRAA